MGTFLIGALVGWIVGVIMTCFFLAKKNLAKMQEAEKGMKVALDQAKDTYKKYSKPNSDKNN